MIIKFIHHTIVSVLLLGLCSIQVGYSQSPTEDQLEPIFHQAEYNHGNQALFKFLSINIDIPAVAYIHGIHGRVFARVDIDSLGAISNITILKSAHKALEEPLILALAKTNYMWKIAKDKDGNAVASSINVPSKVGIKGEETNPQGLDSLEFYSLSQDDVDFADGGAPKDKYGLAMTSLIDGDLEQSIIYMNQAASRYTQTPEFLYQRGIIYYRLGNLKKACKDWKRSITLGSDLAQTKLELYCE